jgi:hypothetical protein
MEDIIIFVSGSCTKKGYEQAEKDFKATEQMLINTGLYKKVVNVFNDIIVSDDKHWKDYMTETYRILLDCNAIYMQKGWEESTGANIELSIARHMKYLIIFEEVKLIND